MEVQFIEHIRHSLLIDRNKDLVIEKLLNLTLEIISLLTREDFIVVRRSSDHGTEGSASPVSDRCTPSPVVEDPPHSPTEEKILEPAPTYHGKAEEVPGDPRDVEVSFSMTDYDYSEEHKDAVMDPPQPHSSAGECSNTHRSAQCETPLYSQDCIKEETRVMTPNYQADPEPRIFHPQYKEEETPLDPDESGEGSSRNLPEPCEMPQYPDCMEEETRMIPQEYQAEPVDVMCYPQCKEEDIPAPISSGCDTGTETAVDPEGGDDGGQEDIPPDPCEGPRPSSHHPAMLFPCSECEESFHNRSDLVTHQKTCNGHNFFQCYICGMSFRSKLNFTAHQQSHTEEKLFPCLYCGRSFSQRARLLSHQRTHTGEKPFSCPECGRCFSERSPLVAHIRIHSGEKPYSCSECGKRFIQRSSLLKHHRTHTGERPFVCSRCGRCFSQSSNLIRHERSLCCK